MYLSYDDRLRAVQVYIKLGKRAGLTIRQLGYPTKNALKAWHQAYEQRQDLPTGYVREPKYTPAQRQLAVDHFAADGRCLAFTIKALGYPSRSLLAGWNRDAHPEVRPRVGQAHEALSSQAKQSAVMALCLRQGSAQAVAQELGVSRPSLYNWKNQLLSNEALASMKPQNPAPSSECDELEREVERLQRAVKRLELEQDILKKANELQKKNWASISSS
jgi:putative transposase